MSRKGRSLRYCIPLGVLIGLCSLSYWLLYAPADRHEAGVEGVKHSAHLGEQDPHRSESKLPVQPYDGPLLAEKQLDLKSLRRSGTNPFVKNVALKNRTDLKSSSFTDNVQRENKINSDLTELKEDLSDFDDRSNDNKHVGRKNVNMADLKALQEDRNIQEDENNDYIDVERDTFDENAKANKLAPNAGLGRDKSHKNGRNLDGNQKSNENDNILQRQDGDISNTLHVKDSTFNKDIPAQSLDKNQMKLPFSRGSMEINRVNGQKEVGAWNQAQTVTVSDLSKNVSDPSFNVVGPAGQTQFQGRNREKTLSVRDLNDAQYVMIHSGKASAVRKQLGEEYERPQDEVLADHYIFASDSLPLERGLRPSVGNGLISTVVHAGEVFMAGLYNGRGSESHRAILPSTCSFNVTHTEPATNFTRTYKLNVASGIYSEVSLSRTYNLTYQLYAHRNLTNVIVIEVDLIRFKLSEEPLRLKIKLNRWQPSYDLTFLEHESGREEVSYKVGALKATESSQSPDTQVHVLYDHVPDELIPPSQALRTKWVFLSVYGLSQQRVNDSYRRAVELVHGGEDALHTMHVSAWASLWAAGRVNMRGAQSTAALSRAIHAAWYALLSSTPTRYHRQFTGLSPCGLPVGGESDQCCAGHVLWDQEMWMYPPLLLVHQPLAWHVLDARLRLSGGAMRNARRARVKGAMFPWLSAATGIELNNTLGAFDGAKAPYVSAGVAYAVLKWVYATNQTQIVTNGVYGELLANISHFLLSKAVLETDLYSIRGVLPPDDSHGLVSNSPFVNAIVSSALSAIGYIYSLEGKRFDQFDHYADKIRQPYDSKQGIHPAFEGYQTGAPVQQADAILLGYPVDSNLPSGSRLNDLMYYEKLLGRAASPMTWAMHTIGWLQVKDFDAADKTFQKLLPLVNNPFQVWTHKMAASGQVFHNYLSAAGAFLQTIINGYAGIRLRADRLDLDPVLPSGVTSMHVAGIDYLGSSLSLYITSLDVSVTVSSRAAVHLTLYVYDTEAIHSLVFNRPVTIPLGKACVLRAKYSV